MQLRACHRTLLRKFPTAKYNLDTVPGVQAAIRDLKSREQSKTFLQNSKRALLRWDSSEIFTTKSDFLPSRVVILKATKHLRCARIHARISRHWKEMCEESFFCGFVVRTLKEFKILRSDPSFLYFV